ncbi:MAG: hypothetical protein CM15mP115_08830 [Alphaproteobacteria bacterium]|nr:MAG: hypothetical protein CM15mP115_08830 [Alphaproteobacteria bacterium]
MACWPWGLHRGTPGLMLSIVMTAPETDMPPDTPLCDFGWKAPAFTLSDPIGLSCSLDG